MKYFNEASVLYMYLTLYIKGMNDIRLISRPIHAPNHELEDTDTNTPPTKVKRKKAMTVSSVTVKVIYLDSGKEMCPKNQRCWH